MQNIRSVSLHRALYERERVSLFMKLYLTYKSKNFLLLPWYACLGATPSFCWGSGTQTNPALIFAQFNGKDEIIIHNDL